MATLAEHIINSTDENYLITKIAEGAFNVNEHDSFGFRPMIQAVICKKYTTLEALLQHGASLEQADIYGQTALQWAATRNQYEYCELLLEYGANPNHHSLDGQPILTYPILREQLELIELFQRFDGDITFAQDFISAKLLGHRYELTGETDIVSPNGHFIPLSLEGFYLEFSTNLVRRSLNNFIHSIEGQKFSQHKIKIESILAAMYNAGQLYQFTKYKDKTPYLEFIDSILDNNLLLLPAAYRGHAITFIRVNDLLAKCDRGVNTLTDTVVIYKMGNPYKFNKEYMKKILYEPKTEEFISKELKEDLQLKPLKTIPAKNQITGNCSWANVEISVPTMLFMISFQAEQNRTSQGKIQKSSFRFFDAWVEWDRDSALDETLEDFTTSNLTRQISKAMILGKILTQRCLPKNKLHVNRAKKILNILTQPSFQFLLRNYISLYIKDVAGSIGKDVINLFKKCNLDLKTLTIPETSAVSASQANIHNKNLVKMTTALHVACLQGNMQAASLLLDKLKIDVNYLDRTGSSALMYAAWKGHYELVQLLVNEYGADPNIKNIKGGSAFHYATHAGHKKIANFLKKFRQ